MNCKPLFRCYAAFLLPPAAALLTGLLLAIATPPFGGAFLAWIAFVPLFWCLYRTSYRLSFVLALVAGVVYYSLAFQWTGAFHRHAVLAISTISGFFFFALPALCMKSFFKRPDLMPVALPSVWVAFELIKTAWPLRFPFGVLGYSQYARTVLIQASDIGGVALVSWSIIFVNTVLFLSFAAFFTNMNRRSKIRRAIKFAALAAFCLVALYGYGMIRLRSLKYPPEPVLKVGFAQTLFHPRKQWSANQDAYLENIGKLSRNFSGLETDLILFPELTVDRPLTFDAGIIIQDNSEILNMLSSLAVNIKANILFGSLELKRMDDTTRTYNSMFHFSPAGDLTGIYRKRLPVPFGEINPFGRVLPGLGKYLRETTDSIELTPGDSGRLFEIAGRSGKMLRFGALICFEGTFGHLARQYAADGADFLVNATNDYWAGSTVAMYQHAVMSVFRAVETRTPVLRISNGGFSCYVDERGRYASSLPVFSEGAMTARLFLLKDKPMTLYVRFGDWFALVCVLLSLACFTLLAFSRRYRTQD